MRTLDSNSTRWRAAMRKVCVRIVCARIACALTLLGLLLLALAGKLYTDRLVRQAEARFPALGQFVTVEGCRLHYVQQGHGQPVLLIHGDGGSAYDYVMSTMSAIAENFQAIAFDRPGMGYSDRPDGAASPFVQARLLHGAAESLGLGRVVVVGHSRGGPVALAYALLYPEDVTGVVMLAGTVFWDGSASSTVNRLLALPGLGQLVAHTAAVPFGKEAVKAGLNAAFAPEGQAPPAYLDIYAAYELRPGQLLAHANDQVRSGDAMQELAARYPDLQTPVVLVYGTGDQNVPLQDAHKLHEILPHSTLIEIEDAGHELMFHHPAELVRAIQLAFQGSATP